jgi:hypothetical protein
VGAREWSCAVRYHACQWMDDACMHGWDPPWWAGSSMMHAWLGSHRAFSKAASYMEGQILRVWPTYCSDEESQAFQYSPDRRFVYSKTPLVPSFNTNSAAGRGELGAAAGVYNLFSSRRDRPIVLLQTGWRTCVARRQPMHAPPKLTPRLVPISRVT